MIKSKDIPDGDDCIIQTIDAGKKMTDIKTQTIKRPRKDEIVSVLKLLALTAKQQRNYADGHLKLANERPESADYLRKAAKLKIKTAERYERIALWITLL